MAPVSEGSRRLALPSPTEESPMHIEVLYFDGCPHWEGAEARLRDALQRLERSDVVISHRQVRSEAQARELEFRGSPTILVDGRDPFAVPDAPVGLSCRLYPTDAGLRGLPSVEQLIEALGG
jgi:hypothetical protein